MLALNAHAPRRHRSARPRRRERPHTTPEAAADARTYRIRYRFANNLIISSSAQKLGRQLQLSASVAFCMSFAYAIF